MDAVRAIGTTAFGRPPAVRPIPQKLFRTPLPEIKVGHYPTYDASMNVGQAALARVQKAELAVDAALYAGRMQLPG